MAHLRVVPAKRAWLEALAESDEAFTALTGVPGGARVDGGVPRHRPVLPRAARRRRRPGVGHPPLLRHRPRRRAGGQRRLEGCARRRRRGARATRWRRPAGTAGSPRGAVAVLLAQASARGAAHRGRPHVARAVGVHPRARAQRVRPRRRRARGRRAGVALGAPGAARRSRADARRRGATPTPTLVRRLLLAQHPQWADLPITRVPSAGTDNAMYRLGDDLVVRLPRIDWAVDNVAKEQRWLPVLAPHLPLAVPLPVAEGAPTEEFPYPWGVGAVAARSRWPRSTGSTTPCRRPGTWPRSCGPCGRSIPTDGPRHQRGAPIRHGDRMVRDGLGRLDGEVDVDALLRGVGRGRRGARARRSADLVPRRPRPT